MRVTLLGNRLLPNSIRDLLSRMGRPHSDPEKVKRREIPYWQERGWRRQGDIYTGTYQTPFASFIGQVVRTGTFSYDFLLYNPSPEIQNHSHWACFAHRGNDWYFVHMSHRARDIDSGIMTIERLITEAYQ
ncbi:MAG: hypothetical protein SFV18_18395 [Bryobacteraceae bacterium]|nr:hypothetical protein [Bryobacteraceae bacterium]